MISLVQLKAQPGSGPQNRNNGVSSTSGNSSLLASDSGFKTKTFNNDTEKEKVEYENVSLSEIQKKYCCRDEECFGCLWKFGKPDDPVEKPEMNRLWLTYVNNKPRLDLDMLAKLLSKTQEELFVVPFKEQGKVCPIWPPSIIKVHLKTHLMHQETEMLDDLDSYRFIGQFLLKRVGKRPLGEGDDKLEENEKTIKLWTDITKDKHSLWTKYTKEFK